MPYRLPPPTTDVLMLAPTDTLSRDRRIILTCNSLAESGHVVHVVAPPQSPDSVMREGLLHAQVQLHLIPERYEDYAYKTTLEHWHPIPLASERWRRFTWFLRILTERVPKNPFKAWVLARIRHFYWTYVTAILVRLGIANSFYFCCQLGPRTYFRYRKVLKLNHMSHWYWVRALQVLKNHRVGYVYAHDLWSLPVACLLKKVIQGPLIFDSHDIGESVIEDPEGKAIARRYEGMLYHQVDRFLTVNESLVDYYRKRYPDLHPQVLFNAAAKWEGKPANPGLRERFHLDSQIPLGVLVGTLNHEACIYDFFDALTHTQRSINLVVIGEGVRRKDFMERARQLGLLDKRVFFTGGLPFTEVVPLAATADFGVIPCIQKHVNFGLNSSAKLYDYIQAGIPIFSDKGIEIDRVFQRFSIGKTVDFSIGSKQLALSLEEFLESKEAMTKHLSAAREYYVWPHDFTARVLGGLPAASKDPAELFTRLNECYLQ